MTSVRATLLSVEFITFIAYLCIACCENVYRVLDLSVLCEFIPIVFLLFTPLNFDDGKQSVSLPSTFLITKNRVCVGPTPFSRISRRSTAGIKC